MTGARQPPFEEAGTSPSGVSPIWLGEPLQFKFVEKKRVAGSIAYVYHAKFTSGSLYWIFSIDDAGKVNGLRFLPG